MVVVDLRKLQAPFLVQQMDLTNTGFSMLTYFDPLRQMIDFFSSKPIFAILSVTKQARSQRRRRMEAYAPLDFDGRGEQLRAASASEVGVGASRWGWSFGYDGNYTWGEGFEAILGVQVHDGDVTHLGIDDLFFFLISS